MWAQATDGKTEAKSVSIRGQGVVQLLPLLRRIGDAEDNGSRLFLL